jgi:L-aminopeptidase/D-esterase-like protein
MGLARNGSFTSTNSGDIFLAFSTHTQQADSRCLEVPTRYLSDLYIDAIFQATVQATEEAVINAMVAARTMVDKDGHCVPALPHEPLRDILRRHHRLREEQTTGICE